MHKRPSKSLMQKAIDATRAVGTSLGRAVRKNRKYFWAGVGLICFSGAAFIFDVKLGLVVTGLAFFFMEWRVDQE